MGVVSIGEAANRVVERIAKQMAERLPDDLPPHWRSVGRNPARHG